MKPVLTTAMSGIRLLAQNCISLRGKRQEALREHMQSNPEEPVDTLRITVREELARYGRVARKVKKRL